MRLIDADALKKAIPNTHVDIFENCRNCSLLDDEQVKQLIDDAPTIELLKEQEAVKPLPQNSNGLVRTIKLWYCGACHSKISRRTSKYCPNCGKPILWEGR